MRPPRTKHLPAWKPFDLGMPLPGSKPAMASMAPRSTKRRHAGQATAVLRLESLTARTGLRFRRAGVPLGDAQALRHVHAAPARALHGAAAALQDGAPPAPGAARPARAAAWRAAAFASGHAPLRPGPALVEPCAIRARASTWPAVPVPVPVPRGRRSRVDADSHGGAPGLKYPEPVRPALHGVLALPACWRVLPPSGASALPQALACDLQPVLATQDGWAAHAAWRLAGPASARPPALPAGVHAPHGEPVAAWPGPATAVMAACPTGPFGPPVPATRHGGLGLAHAAWPPAPSHGDPGPAEWATPSGSSRPWQPLGPPASQRLRLEGDRPPASARRCCSRSRGCECSPPPCGTARCRCCPGTPPRAAPRAAARARPEPRPRAPVAAPS